MLRGSASNVAVRLDPAGNIKPDKERSRERIDGISALANALGRGLVGTMDNGPRITILD
jgi:phage terminase large subunit-like protein